MTEKTEHECCPPFDPEPWDGQEVAFEDRLFVQDRVRSLFHIPLNFGKVMWRNVSLIESADAKPESMIVLSDENSLWGADVYIEVTKEVPGAKMATVPGRFLAKVFEGPYSHIRKWIGQMQTYVEEQGKQTDKLLFYYTTCPKCAKEYGKNYVVILARIGEKEE